jgi:hypothetical protein
MPDRCESAMESASSFEPLPIPTCLDMSGSSPATANETTLLKRLMMFALVIIGGSLFVGILAEHGLIIRIHERPPDVPAWHLVRDGYSPALVAAPWEASTSPFLTLCVLVIVLATWRLARVAADRLYEQHTSVIRAKCGNYMLELLGTTIGRAVQVDPMKLTLKEAPGH